VSDAERLAQHVADLSGAGLPLAGGLRAAAAESSSRQLSAMLCSIADGIEQGRSLEHVLESPGGWVPRHVSGLIRAAARTGQLGEALDTLLDQQRAAAEMRRTVIASLTYPTLVLLFALAVCVVMSVVVVAPFREMFDTFDLELPELTQLVIWWSDQGLKAALGVFAAAVLLGFVARIFLGAARWREVVSGVPLVGPLWHWPGVSQWAQLLGVLVKQGVALPEALQLTANGLSDANVSRISQMLAADVAAGRPLSGALNAMNRLPASVTPFVRWGENTGRLPEALEAASELFLRQVQMRAAVVKSILPPLVFLVIWAMVFFLALALFLPLVELVQGLSW
jgi:general secretion pathway protein F